MTERVNFWSVRTVWLRLPSGCLGRCVSSESPSVPGPTTVAGIYKQAVLPSSFLVVLSLTGTCSGEPPGWAAGRRESEDDSSGLHGGFIAKPAILSTLFQYDS